jgi:hypothetical protein
MSILANASTKVVAQGMIALAALLAAAAPAVAAQAPPAAARSTPSPDGALVGLFDQVCTRNRSAPEGFEAIQWSDVPEALIFLNTYGHDGTFLRRGQGEGAVYIVRTRGAGHMSPGIETRCGIAAHGVDFDRVVVTLASILNVPHAAPMEMGGMTVVLLMARDGATSISRTSGGWVIVRGLGMMIAVPRH